MSSALNVAQVCAADTAKLPAARTNAVTPKITAAQNVYQVLESLWFFHRATNPFGFCFSRCPIKILIRGARFGYSSYDTWSVTPKLSSSSSESSAYKSLGRPPSAISVLSLSKGLNCTRQSIGSLHFLPVLSLRSERIVLCGLWGRGFLKWNLIAMAFKILPSPENKHLTEVFFGTCCCWTLCRGASHQGSGRS